MLQSLHYQANNREHSLWPLLSSLFLFFSYPFLFSIVYVSHEEQLLKSSTSLAVPSVTPHCLEHHTV